MTSARSSYDVVVVGGGHNGLVAATYLARAGLTTLVLERLDHAGGAAGSALSRHADLVAPMPETLVTDLGLDLRLETRPAHRTASYTPTLRGGRPGGLLVEHPAGSRTEESFRELTGGDDEYAAWRELQADVADLAHVVAPTLLSPLPQERSIRDQVDPGIWRDLVATPLGATLEARFADDTVRGLVASDALVGTFVSLHDPSLAQNRAFLYRLLGRSGEERVPVDGWGAVVDALTRAAGEAGAEIVTSAGVSAIRAGDDGAEVTWHDGHGSHAVAARFVLSDVAPWVLGILLGEGEDPTTKPEGAQVTISLLLDRLPRLASGVDPEAAFGGTLHLGQGYAELAAAYDDAAAGRVPSVMAGEVHCRSLPDGTHRLTYVGLHTPASLFERDPAGAREQVLARALSSLDQHLVDPIAACVATDPTGRPSIDVQTPQDLERELAMPGGHLFHGDLDWPWAPNRARMDTPAQQWGVQTEVASVLVCGAGSRRGGGVAGLGGHSAAHAVLASR